MQFLPSTFAGYGDGGDIYSPRDSIMAAGRYLAANGFADNRDQAIYRYNHAAQYVRAVNDYAAVLAADPAAFTGYYRWEVYLKTTAGDLLLPIGYASRHAGPGRGVPRDPSAVMRRVDSAPPEIEPSRPGRKPAASATSTATSKCSPTRNGWCASLPNDTASPPSSHHQRNWATDAIGLRVLISSARPDDANARNTVAILLFEVGVVVRADAFGRANSAAGSRSAPAR